MKIVECILCESEITDEAQLEAFHADSPFGSFGRRRYGCKCGAVVTVDCRLPSGVTPADFGERDD